MMDFPFVQVVPSKVKADGTLRIYGALLDQLAAMKPGDVLQLEGKNGRRYAILLYDDLTSRVAVGKSVEPSK